MADSTSIIKEDGTEDYTTLQAWYDDKDTIAGTHTARLSNEVLDDSLLMNNPSGPDAWIIQPDDGAVSGNSDARHDGRHRNVSGTGALIKSDAVGLEALKIYNVDHPVTIEDICVEPFSSSTTKSSILVNYGGATVLKTVQRCIVDGLGATGGGALIYGTNSATLIKFDANVVYNGQYGIDGRTVASGSLMTHNVAYGFSYGILPSSSVTAKNNISVNTTTRDYNFSSGDDDYNFAEDTTAFGTNSVNSVEVLEAGDTPTKDYIAFANLTPGSEDFSLVDLEHGTYNNVAIAGGVSGTGVATDCARESYASPPSAGAFEVITGTPGTFAATGVGSVSATGKASYKGYFSAIGTSSAVFTGAYDGTYIGAFSAIGVGSMVAAGVASLSRTPGALETAVEVGQPGTTLALARTPNGLVHGAPVIGEVSATRGRPGVFSATGVGSVSATGSRSVPGTFSAIGAGSMAAAGGKGYPGTFSAIGAGSMAAAGDKGYPGTFSAIGVGSVTAVGHRAVPGTFSATGVGSMSAIGVVPGSSDGTFSATGVGTMPAIGLAGRKGTFSATGIGSMSVIGKAGRKGAFQSVGAGNLVANGHRGIPALFSAIGIGSMSGIGHRKVPASFSAIGQGSITLNGHVGRLGSFSAIGIGYVVATGVASNILDAGRSVSLTAVFDDTDDLSAIFNETRDIQGTIH